MFFTIEKGVLERHRKRATTLDRGTAVERESSANIAITTHRSICFGGRTDQQIIKLRICPTLILDVTLVAADGVSGTAGGSRWSAEDICELAARGDARWFAK
jgi:hypothetical protein